MEGGYTLSTAQRVVVKVGSSLLFDRAAKALNQAWLTSFAEDIAALRARGQEVVLVSSGAIALGRHRVNLAPGVLKLEEAQAAAAVGQIDLAHAYRDVFDAHGLAVGQILLTLWDTEERRRYLNARSTLETLLKLGVIPVVNENDTVATSEIRYGDNDRLAARIAGMTSADCLILLSDVDGLYAADPRDNPQADFIPRIEAITPEIAALAAPVAQKNATQLGSGGMVTKIEAARIALGAGCHVLIADGRVQHPLRKLEGDGRCTWFVASETPAQARKHWIAGSLAPRGRLSVDAGAARALAKGMSLLPAGVTGVTGQFERGDAVSVCDAAGREIARGLIAYNARDAAAIKGRKSGEIESLLGFKGRKEMIHRDDLAMMGAAATPPDEEGN